MTRETRKTIARAFYALGDRRGGISVLDLAYGGIAVRTDADKVVEGRAGRKEEEIVEALDASSSPWLEVYRKTYDGFRWTGKEKIMDAKFRSGKKDYQIIAEGYISERTYYSWLRLIYSRAWLWAQELNVLPKKI